MSNVVTYYLTVEGSEPLTYVSPREGRSRAIGMPVPVTPMNEQNSLIGVKDEVGSSGEPVDIGAETDSLGS